MNRFVMIVATVAVLANVVIVPGQAGDSPADPKAQLAACLDAGAASEAIIVSCGVVIDNEATAWSDRVTALSARVAAFSATDQVDRAIADYDRLIKLEPRAERYNSRGELWLKKDDKQKALFDFGAAVRLDPRFEGARANYKALALELERAGAQMAIKNKPAPPLK